MFLLKVQKEMAELIHFYQCLFGDIIRMLIAYSIRLYCKQQKILMIVTGEILKILNALETLTKKHKTLRVLDYIIDLSELTT